MVWHDQDVPTSMRVGCGDYRAMKSQARQIFPETDRPQGSNPILRVEVVSQEYDMRPRSILAGRVLARSLTAAVWMIQSQTITYNLQHGSVGPRIEVESGFGPG
jgi:hypothetical protein